MGNVFGKRRGRSLSVSETVANGHCGVSTNNSKSNYGIDTVVKTKKLVSPFVYQRKRSVFMFIRNVVVIKNIFVLYLVICLLMKMATLLTNFMTKFRRIGMRLEKELWLKGLYLL